VLRLALECIVNDLNAHLSRQDLALYDRKPVMLSHLVDRDGNPSLGTENKIVLLATGLQEEKTARDTGAVYRGMPLVPRTSEPVFLNLHVLFAATHTSKLYAEGLDVLSAIVSHLKAKPVFDRRNTPLMPAGLDSFSVQLERLGYSELNNLWGYLGASYLPSLNYVIRMLGVGPRRIQSLVPAVAAAEVAN
jgi:hypothetical protein